MSETLQSNTSNDASDVMEPNSPPAGSWASPNSGPLPTDPPSAIPATDPIARQLAAFWRARHAEISALVERAEDVGRRLRVAGLPVALCHADAHTANVLIDSADNLWVVDWDETVLAPKERDLVFVVGGGISGDLVGPREEAWFFQGYGDTLVDPFALAYYRYGWAVQDIGSFGEQVLLTPEAGAETRRDAMRIFMRLFQPGEIVGMAFATPIQGSGVRGQGSGSQADTDP